MWVMPVRNFMPLMIIPSSTPMLKLVKKIDMEIQRKVKWAEKKNLVEAFLWLVKSFLSWHQKLGFTHEFLVYPCISLAHS